MAKGTFNQIIIIGNVGKDPETSNLPSGALVCKFNVATEDGYNNKDGEFQSDTNWHRIECFGKLAEIVKQYSGKGQKVAVVGRIKYDEWEHDGEKKKATKIIASNITMLNRVDSGYDNSEDHEKLEADDSVPF